MVQHPFAAFPKQLERFFPPVVAVFAFSCPRALVFQLLRHPATLPGYISELDAVLGFDALEQPGDLLRLVQPLPGRVVRSQKRRIRSADELSAAAVIRSPFSHLALPARRP